MNKTLTTLSAGALIFMAQPAWAQDTLLANKNASEGSTDVARSGFEAPSAPTEDGSDDYTELKVSAGGLFSTGNSRSLAATGTGSLRLRRDMNQYLGQVAVNYAASAPDVDSKKQTTVENYQGRLRYDRFLSRRWALFIGESVRRDRFQGLALRANFDPGVAFYFLTEPTHQLWFEAGYDQQYDIRFDEAIATALTTDGIVIDKTEVRHAARLFAGYNNAINEHVLFYTGLEYLQAFADTKNWRLNWEAALTSSLSDSFSLSTTFNLRYDNNPLPEVRKLDTITAVSLVYTLR